MSNNPTRMELAAVRAATIAASGIPPAAAWDAAAQEIFGDSSTAVKNCPKSAFLGLAEAGHITGIVPGTYTKSKKNKQYAERALRLLHADQTLVRDPMLLWRRVMNGEEKKYNQQMHVVTALWNARKFVDQALDGSLKG